MFCLAQSQKYKVQENNKTRYNKIEMFNLFCPTLPSGSRSNKTFKPKKHIPEGTHQYDLMKHAAVTLGSGNLRQAVMLPDGEDLNEWVAVNSMYFLADLFCLSFRTDNIGAG